VRLADQLFLHGLDNGVRSDDRLAQVLARLSDASVLRGNQILFGGVRGLPLVNFHFQVGHRVMPENLFVEIVGLILMR